MPPEVIAGGRALPEGRPSSAQRGIAAAARSAAVFLDVGAFRTPSLRNVALRAPYMHNGRLATLEEVVAFYNRGGDIDPPPSFIKPRGLSVQQRSDLVAFLRNELTGPSRGGRGGDRSSIGPCSIPSPRGFPRSLAPRRPAGKPKIPKSRPSSPPTPANPSFTVGVFGAPAGAQAVLVIDDADPGAGPDIPTSASFVRRSVALADDVGNGGYASLSLAIPNDPALIGSTLFGRWFVEAGSGVSASPAFRMIVFGTARPPAAVPVLYSVSAASRALGFVAPESIVSGFGANLSARHRKRELDSAAHDAGGSQRFDQGQDGP